MFMNSKSPMSTTAGHTAGVAANSIQECNATKQYYKANIGDIGEGR